MRSRPTRLAPFLALVAVGFGESEDPVGSARPADPRPSFVLVVTDDQGYADLGCQGIRDDLHTPNLDRLAAEGARMTSAYVTSPECTPSRAGILTGRDPSALGVHRIGDGLPEEALTIAERLREAGYATAMVGKWHLGRRQEAVNHGFDLVYADGGRWRNMDRSGAPVEPGRDPDPGYHVEAESAAAAAFVRRHHDRPFFLYLAYRAPHVPLDAPRSYLERIPAEVPRRRRRALAMLAAVDDGVGLVLAALREHDLEERTLVMFLSDHGAPLRIDAEDPSEWNGSSNEPFAGEKKMLSEGGIRVPFLARWSGRIRAGKVYEAPVSALDLAATIAAAADLSDRRGLEGLDLLSALRGAAPPERTLFWRWKHQAAVRDGPWKYLQAGERAYLFDLARDPGETRNRIDEEPRRAEELATRLGQWLAERPAAPRSAFSAWEERYYEHYLGPATRRVLPGLEGPSAQRDGER